MTCFKEMWLLFLLWRMLTSCVNALMHFEGDWHLSVEFKRGYRFLCWKWVRKLIYFTFDGCAILVLESYRYRLAPIYCIKVRPLLVLLHTSKTPKFGHLIAPFGLTFKLSVPGVCWLVYLDFVASGV